MMNTQTAQDIKNHPWPFQDGLEHLMAELQPIQRLLEQRVLWMTQRFESEVQGPFRGYGITPAEAMEHIKRAKQYSGVNHGHSRYMPNDFLNGRVELSIKKGVKLPLAKLRVLFGLSRMEMTVFLTCLLPELFSGFHRVFGFLQDDATLAYPTLGFLMELYCNGQKDREDLRRIFHSSAALRSWRILVVVSEDGRTPPLQKAYRVDERIVSYLMESNTYDGSLDKIILLEDIVESAPIVSHKVESENIIETVKQGIECALVHLTGSDKDAACQFVKGVVKKMGWRLIKAPLGYLFSQKEWNLDRVDILLREAVLQPAGILFYEEIAIKDAMPEPLALLRHLACKGILVFLMSQCQVTVEGVEPVINYTRLEFNTPPPMERFHFWQQAAAIDGFNWPEEVSEQLAMRYPLSKNQANKMYDRLKLRLNGNTDKPEGVLNVFKQVFNEYNMKPLDDLAQRIEAQADWDDLVVQRSLADHLKAFRNTIAHQFTVYEKWGLGIKNPRGRGAVALFSGASGTGKTMAAEVIAHDLGINLYRVDLAGIVSKYIGETEKNLKRIFLSARGANTLLFFDEADALFGKRTDIHDSHDRYSNLEVNYLLQKLEEHDGPIILATNRRKNIDEAFLRRIHFIIEFPLPSEGLRQIIWQKKIPAGVPRSDDVDIPLLAKQFEISGGDIKNASLQAIFIAAESGAPLNMETILTSLRREYLKLGKHFPCSQLNNLNNNVFESPDTRRRKKEVRRFGS